jgi:hypothetical protein
MSGLFISLYFIRQTSWIITNSKAKIDLRKVVWVYNNNHNLSREAKGIRMKKIQEKPLLSFFIASADMTYNEIAEREVYLLGDAEVGYALRGEITGCGDGCYTDLNQVFLEFAMSCEGCTDQQSAEASIARFGRRLGTLLAENVPFDRAASSDLDRLSLTFGCVLNSMSVPFSVMQTADRLEYALDYCPLCQAGQITGLNRELALARHGFAALCQSLAGTVAPDWIVLKPLPTEPDLDLLTVQLVRG